jgi:predicted ATPase
VPGPEHAASVADLEQNPAVQLFVDRARAAQPRFELNQRNAHAVAQICKRLDGIPLALELAAARIPAVAAEQLAARLDQRFRLLTGGSRAALPRQQTLQATLDWSYDLLSRSERRLFEHLAVFAGGWTLDAAEAITVGPCVPHDDVLDLLANLVRKSLVVVTDISDGAQGYALLETMRDYARQKLLARGIAETTATRQRHAFYYSELAGQLCSPPRARSVFAEGVSATAELRDRIDEVHDNLRTALGWWLEVSQPAEGLRLAVALGEFWLWCGMYTEARRWLERMLELANRTAADGADDSASSVSLHVQADALITLGVLASWQGDYTQSCAFLQAAVVLARELHDPGVHAFALAVLGLSLWLADDPEGSSIALDECLLVSLESGSHDRIFQAYRHLGIVACWQGEYERAHELLEKSIAVALQQTPRGGHSFARSLSTFARVAFLQGKYDQARSTLRQTFEVIRDSQLAGQSLADSLDWLAALEGVCGDPLHAARLFGAAEAQWQASGAVRYAPDQPAYVRDVASLRAQLDEDEFAAAWTAGRTMTAQQAIAYALEETRPDLSRTARRPGSPQLLELTDGATGRRL